MAASALLANDAPQSPQFEGLSRLCEGPVQIVVSMAAPRATAEGQLLSQGEIMGGLLGPLLGISAVLGYVAAPLWLAYVLAPGVGLPAGLAGIESLEGARQASLSKAIASVDFPESVAAAIRRRLPDGCYAVTTASDHRIVVLIEAYGIARSSSDEACAVAAGRLELHLPGHEPQLQSLKISGSDGSRDAPPPYCTATRRFFEREGELARHATGETAEILGAIVARRLERTR